MHHYPPNWSLIGYGFTFRNCYYSHLKYQTFPLRRFIAIVTSKYTSQLSHIALMYVWLATSIDCDDDVRLCVTVWVTFGDTGWKMHQSLKVTEKQFCLSFTYKCG